MFTQLIELLKSIAADLVPIAKISQWEAGVVLRFGRFNREIGPGWNFKIPFVETFESTAIVTTTSSLPPQSLVTSDGKEIVVEAIVRYSIADARKFLLDVCDRDDAINDTAMGVIAKQIRSRTWAECCAASPEPTVEQEIAKRVRAALRKWGVHAEDVTIVTMSRMRSIRIVNNANTPT